MYIYYIYLFILYVFIYHTLSIFCLSFNQTYPKLSLPSPMPKTQHPTLPFSPTNTPLTFPIYQHTFALNPRIVPNPKGVWAEGRDSTWSGDYHININMQVCV